ncbi:MAG: hypothetical protein A2Y93_13075 [Chloroflexi bacterium RBG_13_68_17]|nr:MAG: hypothetical protein A2Y93_13075 [Chloroflexi bacterium RBG_13_68_17]
MDESTRARLVEILEAAPEIYLPAGRLLETLQGQDLAVGLDRAAFLTALRADPLFELLEVGGPDREPGPGEQGPVGAAVEPGVKLAARALTADAVMTALAHNLAQLNEALLRAWESRPAGDEQTEAMLLEVLTRAEELGKEIRGIAEGPRGEPPPPGGQA